MDTETIAVPEDALIRHVLAEARELGEYEYAQAPPDHASSDTLDYDWPDASEWDVDVLDDGRIALHTMVTATYSVQTVRARYNPPGKAHPAEYETEEMEVVIGIEADWSDGSGLGNYSIRVEA